MTSTTNVGNNLEPTSQQTDFNQVSSADSINQVNKACIYYMSL